MSEDYEEFESKSTRKKKEKREKGEKGGEEKVEKGEKDWDTEETSKHDFGDVLGGIVGSIPWTMAILLLILYLFINSSIFINDVLKPMYPDAVDIDRTTNLGTIISGIVFVLGYIILDILRKCDVL
jgi:hypothetical protein